RSTRRTRRRGAARRVACGVLTSERPMSGSSEPVVVIGAGQAAAQLAISLRQGGFSGGITVIGDEPYLPYQRPPLSKKFLAEHRPPDVLYLRPETFWRDQDVAFVLGT